MAKSQGILHLGIGLIGLATLAGACQPEPTPLSILSYNLRHDADWWEERFELIADEVAELKPDLIGLQEVEIGIDQELILHDLITQRDPALDYAIYAREKAGLAAALGEGIALFSRQALEDKASIELTFGRVAVKARVFLDDARSVDILNTHLHSDATDEERQQQAAEVIGFLDTSRGESVQLVVGDMNATPKSKTMAAFAQAGWRDTWVEANPEEDGFTSPVILGQDRPEQNFTRRIDYVLAKDGEGDRFQVDQAEVVLKEPRADGLFPSDHLGVWVEGTITQ
jgi:endonuclease/exonuclease/phosphatase family metal-dependent hydrolase